MAKAIMATMAETTMAEMACGRNVLWPNRSVDETSRKPLCYYSCVVMSDTNSQ
jgi:hypothetical protein